MQLLLNQERGLLDNLAKLVRSGPDILRNTMDKPNAQHDVNVVTSLYQQDVKSAHQKYNESQGVAKKLFQQVILLLRLPL